MLGIVLLYVGIVLINNGIARLTKIDAKSAAVMNIFTGALSVTLNILAIKLIEIIITWRKIPSKIEYTKYLLENIPKENADLVLLLRDSDKNNWDTLSTTKAIVWAWIKESA